MPITGSSMAQGEKNASVSVSRKLWNVSVSSRTVNQKSRPHGLVYIPAVNHISSVDSQ